MIRYGPAGWMYADWAGVVYPDPKPRKFDPLRYLARYCEEVDEVRAGFDPIRRGAGRLRRAPRLTLSARWARR